MLRSGAASVRPTALFVPRGRSLVFCSIGRSTSPLQRLLEKPQRTEPPPPLRPPPVRPLPPPLKAGQRLAPLQRNSAASVMQAPKITLAVVGDVHSQWTADDEAALASLGADVAVFVGDFGEENVELIKRVAALPHPKAVILGNHDAWFSLTPSGRRRYTRAMLSSTSMAVREGFSEGGSTPAITAQLAALGEDHIGFGAKRFPQLSLTLLGGRPFSKGGKQWSDIKDFYGEHYGTASMRESAMRLLDVALAANEGDCKVLVAHNGPRGLGGRRHSICGVDWTEPEADFGDPDLQEALDMMASQGLHIPLVLFGHMHSQLSGGGLRNMVEVDAGRGTVYLNAAVVPRIRSLPVPQQSLAPSGAAAGSGSVSHGGSGSNGSGSSSSCSRRDATVASSTAAARGASGIAAAEERMNAHHFLLVELRGQVVTAAKDVWVGVQRSSTPSQTETPAAAPQNTPQQQQLQQHASQGGDGSAAAHAGQPACSGSTIRCIVLREQELLRTSFPATAAEMEAERHVAQGSGAAAAGTSPAAVAAAANAPPAAAAAAADGDGSGSSYVCSIWRANSQEWEPLVLQLPAVRQAVAVG